jgi:hypothetical protein
MRPSPTMRPEMPIEPPRRRAVRPVMRIIAKAGAALAGALTISGCVSHQAPPPAPLPPAPRPVVQAPIEAPPPPPPADWQAAPLSPGDWSYRPNPATPVARFRSVGAVSLEVSCERGRAVRLRWSGAQAEAITVRTSYGERRLRVSEVHINMVNVDLPPADPLLDQMAFSRGRFMVQAEGAHLILPAWPELARVVEDCRGQ